MMSNNDVSHDPIPTEDAAAGKPDANKDRASTADASGTDKIKAAADSVSVKKADVVDDIECAEELQLSFPERLMSLLQDDGGKGVAKAMKWLPDGDAFLLVPGIFYDVVLDGHFHGTKFESFTRKLNRWGFKRISGKTIPKDSIAYHHVLFKKDHPELLDKMRSGRNRHLFVEEQKPTKKQATAAAAAASRNTKNTSMNQQFVGGGISSSNNNNINPLSHQIRAGGMHLPPPQGHSSSLGLSSASGVGGGIGGQMTRLQIEADLVLRRRLDEAMHSHQINNNGYSSSHQADQREALRGGGDGDVSFSPSQMMMGGGGGYDSMELQRIMALRQQQQQQKLQQHQGMDGGGVDPLMGCNGDASSSSYNNQDNQQAHFMAMRQLLVDQRAAARATEDSLRIHQLLSMQGGGSGGNIGGGGAADFAGSNSNGDNHTSAHDAKFYQLMRLRQQLDMVTRNS